jgi:hypothetical protein
MCLTIRAELTAVDDGALRAIAAAAPRMDVRFAYESAGGLFHHHGAPLTLHGCELLADSADWNAPTWDMTADGIRDLDAAFTFVLDHAPDGITTEALWEGDSPEMTTTIARDAFLELVRSGRLGTKAKYIVRPSSDTPRP